MIHYWPSPQPSGLAPCGVEFPSPLGWYFFSGFAKMVTCPDCLRALAPKPSWPPPNPRAAHVVDTAPKVPALRKWVLVAGGRTSGPWTFSGACVAHYHHERERGNI